MSDPVAVIDVGSNSIKLLVAAAEQDAELRSLFTETVETRISGGISRDLPILSDESIQRGSETIVELVRLAREYDPAKIAIVATSAVRDALNGQDFIDRIFEETGIHIRILEGTEEATYIGHGLSYDPQLSGADDFIQMDIGGGSLELIRFQNSQIQEALSFRLGAVRLSEKFLKDPEAPISKEVETAIDAFVHAELSQSNFKFTPRKNIMVGTGGAIVVSRAILAAQKGQKIDEYSPTLKLKDLEALKDKLCALPLHERMSVPHLPASRADIIPTALITIISLLHHAKRDSLTHSFFNLRYGIAAELLND